MDLRTGLLALALLAAGGAALWGWDQQHQVATAKEAGKRLEDQLNRAQQDRDQNLATANQLKSELASERDSQAKLLALQGELRQGLAQRERVIEALKHENQQLREWSDQPLPDAARRLRERPALTGADAYRQWLSGSRSVPAAGDSTDPQRPAAH
ncbi:LysB family phage lysis regulatory protein [Pseudomonas mosselii]|uniref:LysB family phage lysis regulatory protein n=1 Tax=Pseudomonas mosselii TaxID=78327 RepID=A0A7W2PWP8_9PSED|nr:LysB family phage lysis regulatory protein [Pseudomonas mosselii]